MVRWLSFWISPKCHLHNLSIVHLSLYEDIIVPLKTSLCNKIFHHDYSCTHNTKYTCKNFLWFDYNMNSLVTLQCKILCSIIFFLSSMKSFVIFPNSYFIVYICTMIISQTKNNWMCITLLLTYIWSYR